MTAASYRTSNGDLVPSVVVLNSTGGVLSEGGGSVTAAGSNGTAAQSVQGITGGVAVPVSGTIAIGLTTFGAITPLAIVSAASTNATLVKSTTGAVTSLNLSNTSAAFKYFRLFNKASAPVPGTDTPILIIGIPPAGHVSLSVPAAFAFGTGLGYAITGASPLLDATAVALGDVVGTLGYH